MKESESEYFTVHEAVEKFYDQLNNHDSSMKLKGWRTLLRICCKQWKCSTMAHEFDEQVPITGVPYKAVVDPITGRTFIKIHVRDVVQWVKTTTKGGD